MQHHLNVQMSRGGTANGYESSGSDDSRKVPFRLSEEDYNTVFNSMIPSRYPSLLKRPRGSEIPGKDYQLFKRNLSKIKTEAHFAESEYALVYAHIMFNQYSRAINDSRAGWEDDKEMKPLYQDGRLRRRKSVNRKLQPANAISLCSVASASTNGEPQDSDEEGKSNDEEVEQVSIHHDSFSESSSQDAKEAEGPHAPKQAQRDTLLEDDSFSSSGEEEEGAGHDSMVKYVQMSVILRQLKLDRLGDVASRAELIAKAEWSGERLQQSAIEVSKSPVYDYPDSETTREFLRMSILKALAKIGRSAQERGMTRLLPRHGQKKPRDEEDELSEEREGRSSKFARKSSGTESRTLYGQSSLLPKRLDSLGSISSKSNLSIGGDSYTYGSDPYGTTGASAPSSKVDNFFMGHMNRKKDGDAVYWWEVLESVGIKAMLEDNPAQEDILTKFKMACGSKFLRDYPKEAPKPDPITKRRKYTEQHRNLMEKVATTLKRDYENSFA